MRLYLVSLGAGLLVGIIYSLLNVRSPAPPAVALVGLLGILAGEQILPMAKQLLAGTYTAALQSTQRNLNAEAEHSHEPTNTNR